MRINHRIVMESHLVFCRGESSRNVYNTYNLSFLVLGSPGLRPRLYQPVFWQQEIDVVLCMAVLLLFTLDVLFQTEEKL